jgi:hypothetical protein
MRRRVRTMFGSRRRGSALATALIALMFVLTAGAGLLSLSLQSMRRSRFDVLRPRALALADAGVEKALYYLRTTAPNGTTDGSWRATNWTEQVAGYGSFTVTVASGTGANLGRAVITSVGRASEGYTGAAQAATPGQATLAANTATTDYIQVQKALRVAVTIDRQEVSIWNNAIFGGVGQSGKSINGNVRIRGSVHLLGDGESFTDTDKDGHWDDAEPYTDSNHNGSYDAGESFTDTDGDGHRDAQEPFVDVNGNATRDPALTVTDLGSEFGGDANIGNNYEGMPSDMRALVPTPPQVAFHGETVESLKAKLRVKNGQVSLNGSATVGEPDATGGVYEKETMDGTYVSDGFTGNAGASQVYSDNGTKAGYDLGDMLHFPDLVTPYSKNGYTYDSYMDYLKANALVVNNSVTFTPG